MVVALIRRGAKKLPPSYKRLVREFCQRATSLQAEAAADLVGPEPGPIGVAGFFSSPIGLGEAARRQLRLLESLRPGVTEIDLTSSIIPDRARLPESPKGSSNNALERGGVLVFHINPPEMPLALRHVGSSRGKYRIGYWVYELQTVPFSWRSAGRLVNEIWTPSRFSAEALQRGLKIPSYVLPPPLQLCEPAPGMRSRLGIARNTFVALNVFDVKSSMARKNPEAAIAAFRQAFPLDCNARLVVKVSNLPAWSPAAARLSEARDSDPRVVIVTETLSQKEMSGLVEDSNCILSLHRSEGFGLLLAEGMARARPVIATGWSGNLDFMRADCSLLVPYRLTSVKDPQGIYSRGDWAEPDVEAASKKLLECFNSRKFTAELGQKARQYITRDFNVEAVRNYKKRLQKLNI